MVDSSNAVVATGKKINVTPLQRALSDPATQVFAFMSFFILLAWPVLQISGVRGTLAVFVHVFVIWALLIGVLMAISRAQSRSDASKAGNEGGE